MNSSLSIEEIVLINCLLYCENLGGPRGTFLSISQESRTIGDFVDGVLHYAKKLKTIKNIVLVLPVQNINNSCGQSDRWNI